MIPVAAKKTFSPEQRSGRSSTTLGSFPSARTTARSPSSRGQRRACMPPPTALTAHALSTPSGAPPMPMSASIPVHCSTAAITPAATSPSVMSFTRAPATRISWSSRS